MFSKKISASHLFKGVGIPRSLGLVACVLLFAWSSGCDDGSADRIRMRKACLEHIFSGYAAHVDAHEIGPADIESFRQFMDQNPSKTLDSGAQTIAGQVVADEAIARMKDVDIVVIWAAKFPEEEADWGESFVAFEAGAPGKGGYIVTSDGIVQHVTAAKFSELREISQ